MTRILVADDEVELRDKYTAIILRKHPHATVNHVSTGKDLVNSAKVIKYDLIFTDDSMGEDTMSGTSAVIKIRRFDKETPIIMISACDCTTRDMTLDRREERRHRLYR